LVIAEKGRLDARQSEQLNQEFAFERVPDTCMSKSSARSDDIGFGIKVEYPSGCD